MRKGFALSLGLAGLLVAGCAGQSEAPSAQPQPAGDQPPAQEQSGPVRTAPAKAVDVADQCTSVPPEKLQALGIDQPPRARESVGQQGCQLSAGPSGSPNGWGAFVAVDPNKTTDQFAASTPQGNKEEIAGYPAHVVDKTATCNLSLDVSDQGSVYVQTIVRPGADRTKIKACEKAKPIAEAMAQNLPNA